MVSMATHPAKPFNIGSFADCHAINNQINDEWLIRDQGAIVRQLGWDPKAYAVDLIKREGGFENCVKPFTPEIDVNGPYKGRGNDNEWGARYADILNRIMGADMAAIPASYDEACHLELPGGVTAHGHDAADRFWMGLRASFPNATFTIEHQIGRDDAGEAPRAALRWGLHGAHDGWGALEPPQVLKCMSWGSAMLNSAHAGYGENMWCLMKQRSGNRLP